MLKALETQSCWSIWDSEACARLKIEVERAAAECDEAALYLNLDWHIH